MVHTPVTSVLSTPLGGVFTPSRTRTPLDVPLHAPLLAERIMHAQYFYVVEPFSMDFARFDVTFEVVNRLISLLNVMELLHYSRVSKFCIKFGNQHEIWSYDYPENH